jgi:alpha-L-arabinofuranosidase
MDVVLNWLNCSTTLHPKFMRFPGGCFVEGLGNEENMFKWKRTVGPIETRPGHMNSNWGYRTSDGMGFHEFLQLAEDIGAKPLFVVNVGIWHGGYRDIKDLKTTYLQDALDAIEYANGDVTTKYGAMRAANGTPCPI